MKENVPWWKMKINTRCAWESSCVLSRFSVTAVSEFTYISYSKCKCCLFLKGWNGKWYPFIQTDSSGVSGSSLYLQAFPFHTKLNDTVLKKSLQQPQSPSGKSHLTPAHKTHLKNHILHKTTHNLIIMISAHTALHEFLKIKSNITHKLDEIYEIYQREYVTSFMLNILYHIRSNIDVNQVFH